MTQLPAFKDGVPVFSGSEPAFGCGEIYNECIDLPTTMPKTFATTLLTFDQTNGNQCLSGPDCGGGGFCAELSGSYVLQGSGIYDNFIKGWRWQIAANFNCWRANQCGKITRIEAQLTCRFANFLTVRVNAIAAQGLVSVGWYKNYFFPLTGLPLIGQLTSTSSFGEPCIGGSADYSIF